MNEIPDDDDSANRILGYSGYLIPPFFSDLLGELPEFAFPDWGPIPPLPRERPVTPPSRNPNLPPAHEVDPPDRPPEWLFGPPRIVQASESEPVGGGLLGMIQASLRSQGAMSARSFGAPPQQAPVNVVNPPARQLSSYGVRY
jgi:hypothetical protein